MTVTNLPQRARCLMAAKPLLFAAAAVLCSPFLHAATAQAAFPAPAVIARPSTPPPAVLRTMAAQPAIPPPASMTGGVNLSGLEFNAGTIPGRANWDYAVPNSGELDYYHGKGLNLIRLPVLWERLQPILFASTPSATMDTNYLGLIQQLIAEAAARHMLIVVDLHDYGGYGSHKIGDPTLPSTLFANLWRSLASQLAGHPGLGGYDLMNEPSNMPSSSVWPAAAQRAVSAIRTVDTATPVYVEGDNWASAPGWTSSNANLSIHDPINRLTYEAHVYGDRDNSGTHFVWSQEAAAGVTVATIANRVVNFTGWCRGRHVACMIGEVGVGNDDPHWNIELANGLTAMQSGGIAAFTYWAGGPWWGTYPMSIEPSGTTDAPQMAVVSAYGH